LATCHVDRASAKRSRQVADAVHPLTNRPPARPALALRGYRDAGRGVPATCLLMVCPSGERETQLHEHLAAAPLPVPVAATTLDRPCTPAIGQLQAAPYLRF